MIEFHLDSSSGVPTYLQLVQQVKQALRVGLLQPGDQLPTVKETVAKLAINPNTVQKAYRELHRDGIVEARPGRGTFLTTTLAAPRLDNHEPLRAALLTWLENARRAGLDDEAIAALLATTLRAALLKAA